MNEVMRAVFGLTALFTLLGILPWMIWFFYTLWKRRWRKAAWQAGIPAAWFLLLFSVEYLRAPWVKKTHYRDLFDAETEMSEPVFNYESERSFNGDGYSLAIIPLPPAVKAKFLLADHRLLSEFPRRPDYREHWQTFHWRKGPVGPTFAEPLSFILSEPGLSAQHREIRAALARDTTYYAAFLNGVGSLDGELPYPSDMDFFIIDLQNDRLYLLNQNT